MDPPPPETLILALEQLYALGALNHMGELTKVLDILFTHVQVTHSKLPINLSSRTIDPIEGDIPN